MFKSLTDCYELSNGVKIPCVGFGMWQTPNGEVAVEAAKAALKAGYRHIDTAQGYGNEGSVGQAIAQSGIPREEIFITSKLNNGVRGYEETIAAFEESCKLLGTDYIDLFLIHWPNPLKWRENWKHHNAETWRAFEDLYKAGRIRAAVQGVTGLPDALAQPMRQLDQALAQIGSLPADPTNEPTKENKQ